MQRRAVGGSFLLIAGGALARDTVTWAWEGVLNILTAGMAGTVTWSTFPWINAVGVVAFVSGGMVLIWPTLKRIARRATLGEDRVLEIVESALAENPAPLTADQGRSIAVAAAREEIERQPKLEFPSPDGRIIHAIEAASLIGEYLWLRSRRGDLWKAIRAYSNGIARMRKLAAGETGQERAMALHFTAGAGDRMKRIEPVATHLGVLLPQVVQGQGLEFDDESGLKTAFERTDWRRSHCLAERDLRYFQHTSDAVKRRMSEIVRLLAGKYVRGEYDPPAQ